jgi:hypothetical protein
MQKSVLSGIFVVVVFQILFLLSPSPASQGTIGERRRRC